MKPTVPLQEQTSPEMAVVFVVGPQFLAANHGKQITITKKFFSSKGCRFSVTDATDQKNVIFTDQGSTSGFYKTSLLSDSLGKPVLSLQRKILTSKWQVYRGESDEEKDLLFTVRKSSTFQFRPRLNVYLTGNKAVEFPDFHIESSYFKSRCKIYSGKTSKAIAQMQKRHCLRNFLSGKTKYSVTVSPSVDFAFITALIMILHGISVESNSDGDDGGGGGGCGGGCGGGD